MTMMVEVQVSLFHLDNRNQQNYMFAVSWESLSLTLGVKCIFYFSSYISTVRRIFYVRFTFLHSQYELAITHRYTEMARMQPNAHFNACGRVPHGRL